MSYAPGAPQTAPELRAAFVSMMTRAGRPRHEVLGEPWPEYALESTEHLYVLAFDDGMVKIGRTYRPSRRLREFRDQAKRFGRVVVNGWLSRPSKNADQAELVAKHAILRAGGLTRAGTEYFDGIAFEDAICATVEALDEAEAHP